jgi:hypothetical protein
LTDFGKVKSIHQLAGKTIVVVCVHNGNDTMALDQVTIMFGHDERAYSLNGYKWWPDRKEVDFLFNEKIKDFDTGVTIFIVSRR